tara:strand:- start:1537 stop:2178 length:642 start_codon:yes stop_codon:yes gene_type:complete
MDGFTLSPISIIATLSGGVLLIPLIIYRRRKLSKYLKKWYIEMIKELYDYLPNKKEVKKFIKHIKKELKGKSYYDIKYDLKEILENFKDEIINIEDIKTIEEVNLKEEKEQLEKDLDDINKRLIEINKNEKEIKEEKKGKERQECLKKSLVISKDYCNNRRLLNKIETIIQKEQKDIVINKEQEMKEEVKEIVEEVIDEMKNKMTKNDSIFLE